MTTIIPFESLDPDTLSRLVQEFVTRDGTDYGVHEQSLEDKTQSILQQIRVGRVVIVFDQASESVNLFEKDKVPS